MERVVVFGKMGTGKSTLGNMLWAGRPSPANGFPTGLGFKPVTSSIDEKEGRGWNVTDTIGMGEPKESGGGGKDFHINQTAQQQLKQHMKKLQQMFTYFIYVTKAGRHTEYEKIYWNCFKEIFAGAESNFVVVFTHADNAWIKSNKLHITDAFGDQRFIAVDFPGIVPEPEPEDVEDLSDEDTTELEEDRRDRNKFNERKRTASLVRLENTLRGYGLRPVLHKLLLLNDDELDIWSGNFVYKVKALIKTIFSVTTPGKIWNYLVGLFSAFFN